MTTGILVPAAGILESAALDYYTVLFNLSNLTSNIDRFDTYSGNRRASSVSAYLFKWKPCRLKVFYITPEDYFKKHDFAFFAFITTKGDFVASNFQG